MNERANEPTEKPAENQKLPKSLFSIFAPKIVLDSLAEHDFQIEFEISLAMHRQPFAFIHI